MGKYSKILLSFLTLSSIIFIITIFFDWKDNDIVQFIGKGSGIVTLALTISFTITFNFNLKASFNKEIKKLRVKIKNLSVNYFNKININYENNKLNQPCLSVDVVGYTISENLLSIEKNNDAVQFDNPEDLNRKTKYFILLNPDKIVIQNTELTEIKEYRRSTFEKAKNTDIFPFKDKPYYLFVFNLKNVSKEHALQVSPVIESKLNANIINNMTQLKGLAPNEEMLFMILIENKDNNYVLHFTYKDNTKRIYKQTLEFIVKNNNLEIFDDKLIPPVVSEQ